MDTLEDVTGSPRRVSIDVDGRRLTCEILGTPEAWAQLKASFVRGAEFAVEAGEFLGCRLHEVSEVFGEEFGPLTAPDILEQKQAGLEGREALVAALPGEAPQAGSRGGRNNRCGHRCTSSRTFEYGTTATPRPEDSSHPQLVSRVARSRI